MVAFRVRRRAAVLAGSALLVTGLPFTLTACGSDAPEPGQRAAEPALVSARFGTSLTAALKAQVTSQDAAARQAAAREAAGSAPESRKVCTTDPADRSACRNPGGKIDPNGGDVDGDGVFEPHEPVGPGYRDPRAYDGGKTSGETQCEWLRSRGIAC
ncbi:hypothetical protein AR457_24075 [Streptomyces agglomeratus]|uniref:hypothetical protein n=1 Tax=Streptomyces agglomeratus TaxID=285458 RepID=UPI0008544F29|nr:hypothetical protein [Streptomyces agglomeratus]OEJ38871.1 hypothetical protein BGK70_12575 [Streptomyces agglomeratus]OEJ46745.1 hypothetical protein AR457_24075 [Streptomyces agglomeratus]